MSAPRVPAGWTREATDLVWEDWLTALRGEEGHPLGGGYSEDWTEVDEDTHPNDLAALDSLFHLDLMERHEDGEDDDDCPLVSGYRWADERARLRAWAAVGAPVLAPAEDGRPSLAEWVAACEGSALGRSQAWWDETVEPATTAILGFQWGPFPALASGNALGFICAIIPQGTVMINGWQDPSPRTVTTPAELRALLDTLARPE